MQEKSKGVILFANNTQEVDYVQIANNSAKLIKHFLNLPVTLITDKLPVGDFVFDSVIQSGTQVHTNTKYYNGKTWQWKNKSRYRVYDLTPYDTTILLDADYLVLSKNLNKLLETNFDYLIMSDSHSSDSKMTMPLSQGGINFVWATVIAFNKTDTSAHLFDLVRRIENNYQYFCSLFNIFNQNFRNDYAFAIADLIINGYSIDKKTRIPWSMFTLENPIKQIERKNNSLVIREQTRAHIAPVSDIHVMDKDYLMTEEFNNFIDQVINAT